MYNESHPRGNFTFRVRACTLWRLISDIATYLRQR
jgi:hypothetical protein